MDKSKREQRLEKKRLDKRNSQIKWTVIVSVIAIGLVAMFIFAGQIRQPSVDHDYANKNGNFLGEADAPVQIIEYADFQCSHCRNFYATTESQLISSYVETGLVLYEIRPLGLLGPESVQSAEAAMCAADQNFFWEYHDLVFTNYSTSNVGGYSQPNLLEFASALDMNQDQFADCLSSGEKEAVVEAFANQAASSGVTGTPSFLVNGQVLAGNVPFATLSAVIESAMGN